MNKKKILKITILVFILLSIMCFPKKYSYKITNKTYKDPNTLENTVTVGEVKNGTFDIIISNVATTVNKIQVPVWSTKDQNDIYWYDAVKQNNGNWKVTVQLKNHKYNSGNYHMHFYFKNNNTARNKDYVKDDFPPKTITVNKGTISLDPNNTTSNKYKITLSNSDYYQDKILFAVWSENGGQDDLHWYDASKANGSSTYTIETKNFKSFGIYHVHAYAIDAKGKNIILTTKDFEVQGPKLDSYTYDFNPNNNDITIKLKFSNAANISKVEVPTWSEGAGQDDIKWYTATKQDSTTYIVKTNLSAHHFSLGKYISHIYVTTTSKLQSVVAGISKDISLPSFTVKENSTNTGFDINFANYSRLKGYKLSYAVWSNANGQDDINWYDATNGNYSGSFSQHIKNNKIDSGTWSAHLYAIKNGKYYFVDSEQFTVTNPKFNTVTFANKNSNSFDVIINNVDSKINKVLVPVWSSVNGQDDIKWYSATKQKNGTWKATVQFKNHKYNTGLYGVHVYLYKNNTNTNVICSSYTVTLTKGTFSTQDINNNNMNIKVNLTDSDYANTNLLFAVWSNDKGQDDLKWYTASKSGRNAYVTVPITNHKTAGEYSVHIYSNNTLLLKGSFNIENVNFTAEKQIIDLSNANDAGAYKIIIKNIYSKSGISKVQVPVWSTKNQNDIYWYNATRQSDGSYIATINPKNHKYNTGKYYTHIYVYGNNGVFKCIDNIGDTNISLKPNYKLLGQDRGNYKIRIYNTPPSIKKVRVPTWSQGIYNDSDSDKKGSGVQDDIEWYDAAKQSDGSYIATIKVSNHAPYGKTDSHIYVDNQAAPVACMTYDIKKYDYKIETKYSQKEAPWNVYMYGLKNLSSSGCMPTAIAMAVTAITGKRITPPDVANYLYYNTNQFNRGFLGSGGLSVVYASQHYGVTHKSLSSARQIKDSLKRGRIVIAAVNGNSKFVNNPYTHAIVLYGYDNGYTNVVDPNAYAHSGRASVDREIAPYPSGVAEDLNAGTAFHALY